jgi:putative transposase
MMIFPPPRPRHTTNSNHRYHKWKNLIKDIILTAANQLWVVDITYIATAEGVCYLHLVTDAYSHKVVGWVLSDTLRASASIEALRQAIKQAVAMTGSNMLKGLTHHSDRGVQYCCDAYVAILKSYGISISMTEDYKPTDNAIAERVNGIIKEECVYRQRQFNSSEHASEVIFCFEIAKGILSSCERMPFSVRYVCFHQVKDGLLQVKDRSLMMKNL